MAANRAMPAWLSLLLLLCDRAAAQIRLLPPFPDPSICAGLCADNRCNTDTEHASGLIESACASIVAGEEQAAVGQQMLQPPAPLLEEGSNYFSFSSDTISRWEYAAGKWELHGAELAHAGDTRCSAGEQPEDGCLADVRCVRPWPSMESKAAPGISAALVELSGDCAVETKALALERTTLYWRSLGARDRARAVLAACDAVRRAIGGDQASRRHRRTAHRHGRQVRRPRAAALRSFTNLPCESTSQSSPIFGTTTTLLRWLIFSAIIGPLWFVLLLFALHNLRAHVRSHGVRVSSDKVMQILLIVLITALVRTIRGCWLWGRTSMGDLVSPWVYELIRSFNLPLIRQQPMITASRLEKARSRLRQIAKLARETAARQQLARSGCGTGGRQAAQEGAYAPRRTVQLLQHRHDRLRAANGRGEGTAEKTASSRSGCA